MKWFYDLIYSRFRAPWDLGPRKELVEAVESGRIQPCKAIDLGCGTASNAIFLAQHGFEVSGTDYSPAAIALCQQRGADAGVTINWIEDDLTELRHVRGNRCGLVTLAFATLFPVIGAASDVLVFCPSPCQGAWYPNTVSHWATLISGLTALAAVGMYLKGSSKVEELN